VPSSINIWHIAKKVSLWFALLFCLSLSISSFLIWRSLQIVSDKQATLQKVVLMSLKIHPCNCWQLTKKRSKIRSLITRTKNSKFISIICNKDTILYLQHLCKKTFSLLEKVLQFCHLLGLAVFGNFWIWQLAVKLPHKIKDLAEFEYLVMLC
jgi:hypothetical protein